MLGLINHRLVWSSLFVTWFLSGTAVVVLLYVHLHYLNFTTERLFYSTAIFNGGVGFSAFMTGLRDREIAASGSHILVEACFPMTLSLGLAGYTMLLLI